MTGRANNSSADAISADLVRGAKRPSGRKQTPRQNGGPTRFRANDLKDPQGLLVKLREAHDPLSQYLCSRFPEEVRQQIEQYDEHEPPSENTLKAVLGALNRSLEDPALYEAQRFARVALTSYVREVLSNRRDEDAAHLNWLLLEEAYPEIRYQPYVGPRPFETEDQATYFGRDRELGEVLCLVLANPALLLYAESGTGKTSLLNAGLIPRLEKRDLDVLPLARVQGELPQGIEASQISNIYAFHTLMSWARDDEQVDPQQLTRMTLTEFSRQRSRSLDRYGESVQRVVIFDQFEELFTFYQDRWDEREEFFAQVEEALQQDRLLRVLFAMREDYIAHLDPYTHFLPESLRTRYRLERMDAEAAHEAVEGPLRGTGYSIASKTLDDVLLELREIHVLDVSGKPVTATGRHIEPMQLQIVCENMWQELDPGTKTLSVPAAAADVDQALHSFYQRAIRSALRQTRVKEQPLRDWFSQQLITPAGTRGTVFQGESDTGGIPNETVQLMENLHLIRAESRSGGRWYELIHDRFIEPIRKSNQKSFTRHRRRRWCFRVAGTMAVLLFVSWSLNLGLTKWHDFREREKNRVRAENQREKNRVRAEKLITAAQDVLQANDDLELGILLSAEAVKTYPSEHANKVLRSGLTRIGKPVATLSPPFAYIESSPNGQYIATLEGDYTYNPTAWVWSRDSDWKGRRLLDHDKLQTVAAFKPNSRTLVTADYRSYEGPTALLFWDPATGEQTDAVEFPNFARKPLSARELLFACGLPLLHATTCGTRSPQALRHLVVEVARAMIVAHQRQADVPEYDKITEVAWSSNGDYLATARVSVGQGDPVTTITISHEANGQKIVSHFPLRGNLLKLAAIVFGRDGNKLAIGDYLATLRVGEPDLVTTITITIWHEANGWKRISQLPLRGNLLKLEALAFSPDGNELTIVALENDSADDSSDSALVWKCDTQSNQFPKPTELLRDATIHSIALSSHGKLVAVLTEDNTIRIWKAANGWEELDKLAGGSGNVRMAFSPTEQILAVAESDVYSNTYQVKLWRFGNGRKEMVATSTFLPKNFIAGIACSSDGRQLGVLTTDVSSEEAPRSTVHIWVEDKGWKEAARWSVDKSVTRLILSPDGRYAVTAHSAYGRGAATPNEASESDDWIATVWEFGRDSIGKDLLADARCRVTRPLTASELKRYLGPDH